MKERRDVRCRFEPSRPHRIRNGDAVSTRRFFGGSSRRKDGWHRTHICRTHALFLLGHVMPSLGRKDTIAGYDLTALRRRLAA